jgi:hypothetical protein
MRDAAFIIEQETPEYIFILGVGPWDKHLTVTNAAESVIETLAKDHVLGDYRVFYRDSEGQIDELLHTSGKFIGFKAGHEGINLQG